MRPRAKWCSFYFLGVGGSSACLSSGGGYKAEALCEGSCDAVNIMRREETSALLSDFYIILYVWIVLRDPWVECKLYGILVFDLELISLACVFMLLSQASSVPHH